MKAPFIGIASSFSDLVPGHIGMRDLERQIEKGIHSGGGQAFIFGVPAICDGIAMGHSGMVRAQSCSGYNQCHGFSSFLKSQIF